MLCAKVIVLNLLTVRNKQSKPSDVTQRLLLLHFLSYAFVIHPTVTTNQIWFSHDGLREIKTKIHPDSENEICKDTQAKKLNSLVIQSAKLLHTDPFTPTSGNTVLCNVWYSYCTWRTKRLMVSSCLAWLAHQAQWLLIILVANITLLWTDIKSNIDWPV